MARLSRIHDTQMATDAFRDLVGWFPRSGKAAERLWVQHQGILADVDKLAERQQKVDVIFLQAGDPFLARVKDLNVEVLQANWISESLSDGQLSSVASFRLTDAPQPFPTRSLPPSPRSQSAHADEAEPAHTNEDSMHNIQKDARDKTLEPEAQMPKSQETFSPVSQSGFSTGLFACPTAPTVVKVESPPLSLPFTDSAKFAEPTIQIRPEDTAIKVLTVAPAAPSSPLKISIEEKMEGIRRSIEHLSAKQGIRPPVKRERHSPVLSLKSPPKATSTASNITRGDWRAYTAAVRSLNEDTKSQIRSYSTRRGRSMSCKQEEDEAVLAVSGTPLSMRRKAPYSRNTAKQTSVYSNSRSQRVLLSPIKIKNTVARSVE